MNNTQGPQTIIGNVFACGGAINGALIFGTRWLDTGSTFVQNVATGGNGGGACVSDTSVLTSTRFISNQAAASGGGALVGANVSFNGVNMTGNQAGQSGGGAIIGAGAVLTGSRFSGNIAGLSGGGAYVGANAILAGSQFSGNVASQNGGGAFLGNNTVLAASQFISNNTSGYGGGASLGSNAVVTGTLFRDNTATNGYGGGAAVGAQFTRLQHKQHALYARHRIQQYAFDGDCPWLWARLPVLLGWLCLSSGARTAARSFGRLGGSGDPGRPHQDWAGQRGGE